MKTVSNSTHHFFRILAAIMIAFGAFGQISPEILVSAAPSTSKVEKSEPPDWVTSLGGKNASVLSPDQLKGPALNIDPLKTRHYQLPSYPISYDAPGGLTIEPIVAYNLIVDSNVLSPSSYGPSSATMGAKFCNPSTTVTLNNAWAYIGNYDANYDGTLGDAAIGTYPVRKGTAPAYDPAAFAAAYGNATTNPIVDATSTDYGGPAFSLQHESGSVSVTQDASRYLGTLDPGECVTQYWLVSYPRKAQGSSWSGWRDVTGGVKGEDDLWLPFFFWGSADTVGTSYDWRAVTMRNEISAMANKIWPNGDNKVPDEYLQAIQDVLGWDTITPSGTNAAYPGETVTSQGIWYDLGNVGAGFDNNYDLVPDRNAWVQPIGDAGSYDPGCFRLVQTYGIVIVKLNDGTELLIPFSDQMYFENIPDNNTGAVGLVYYRYMALDGACTAGLTPYQEVASGEDNEKFNADFGAGIPPLQSQETDMTLDKTGPGSVNTNSTVNYTVQFALPESTSPTMFISVGSPSQGLPLVFEDTIPSGMAFISPVSPTVTMTNYSSPTLTATMLYSTNSGSTWSTTAPANGTLSTSPNNLIKIQWWLPEAINQKPQGGGTVYGSVSFSATSPTGANPPPTVTNTACLKLGNGANFLCDPATTLINGSYSISGTVFCDDGTQTSSSGPCSTGTASSTLANSVLDAGGGEPGMPNVSVYLYYDSNGNGTLDTSSDTLVNSTTVTNASGLYTFSSLPAGTYFTQVIKTDTDIQSTYGITGPESLKATITTASVTGLDFGFAPPLSIEKSVDKTTGVGGSVFTYTITLNNNLPGSGAPGNACVYRVWAGQANQSGGTPPGGGPVNSQWQNAGNTTGRPDGQVATTIMSNNSDEIGLTRFNTADMGGTITSVGYRIVVSELLKFDDDSMIVDIYDNATIRETDTYTVVGSGSGIETFTGPTGKQYIIDGTITWVPTGGWTFSDFSSAVNRFGMRITGNRNGGTSGDLALDAVAFTITTDQTCSGADTTLDPVPLTDVFRNDHFSLVSTNPPYNSTSVSGTDTTISWNNVGPIYPGGYKQVTITLKSNDVATTSLDTATSVNSKFTNGSNANSPVSDTVTVTITDNTDPRSITGKVFDDNTGTSGWTGSAWAAPGGNTGMDGTDVGIRGALVTLYQCVLTATGAPVTNAGANRTCAEESGEWRAIETAYTNASGDYSFVNLVRGYYYVQVDSSTVSGAQTADVNQTGACTTCDSRSNDPNNTTNEELEDTAFVGDLDDNTALTTINFGYNVPSGTFNLGDTLYYDWDGDGVQDANEEGISGVTVELLRADGSLVTSQTTTSSGGYLFSSLSPAVYTVRIVDSSLPTYVSQTGDPDESGTCSVCNNTSTVSLTASNLTRDFGYKPYGSAVVGDAVWKDMDGDGFKSGVLETGIANITVNLLVDMDGNGTWVTVKTTTTNSSGQYQFSSLPDGTYRIQVDTADADLPTDSFSSPYTTTTGSIYTGIVISGGVVTSMTNPAWSITSTTTNGFGDTVENDALYLDADFGFAPLGSFGDTVYWDSNGNATQDYNESGINGVTVRLYTFTDAGDDDGNYDVGEAFTDLNNDGDWDSGEPWVDVPDGRYGFGEVLSGSPYATDITATDPDTGKFGFYQFTGLPIGDYVAVVDTTSAPIVGRTLTGDPDTDGFSCVDLNYTPDPGEPSKTVCDSRQGMQIFVGTNYMGADFGYQPLGTIGNRLWVDVDQDGMSDVSENGIPNITVELRDNGTNALITSQVTDLNGYYTFQDIPNGTYKVIVLTGDADMPSGLTNTYDPDGTNNSETVVIVAGNTVTSVGGCTDADGCDPTADGDLLRLDADFGYTYVGASNLSGTVCLETSGPDGYCGTADGSGVTSGETAYAGTTVYLFRWTFDADDEDGDGSNVDPSETVQIAVATTNASGDYTFTNIPDGGYYVVGIGAPQDGLDLGSTVATINTANDSNNNDTNNTTLVRETYALDGDTVSTYQVVNMGSDTTVFDRDFAFIPRGTYDYGDLSDTYNITQLSDVPDGARHTISTIYLGASAPDSDSDGQASNLANGDDTDGDGDDENGITITWDPAPVDTNWANGVDYTVSAVVAAPAIPGTANDAYLIGWIDFNDDGDFNDSNEMVINQWLDAGTSNFNLTSPAISQTGSLTFNSRFRVFASKPAIPQLAYAGLAMGGEVEDYSDIFDLTIDKDTSTNAVSSNGTVVYTVLVTNTGNQPLTNLQVTDSLPDFNGTSAGKGYTVASVTSSLGSLTINGGFDGNTDTNLLTASTSSLAVSASATITITLNLSNASQGTYDNTAAALAGGISSAIDDNGTVANDPGTPTGPTTDPETDEDVTVVIAAIGNSVWLDEDGNGIQDAGEAGLPNITVQLWNSTHTVMLDSTVTDANGAYIFKNIGVGTYQVDVLDSSLPTGLVQTTVIGGSSDFTNKADPYTVTISASGENMSADFGYNYAPSTDTDNNTNTGAIGDRVWVDDGDGVQEPGEPGLGGVTVTIYYDPDANGVFDTPYTVSGYTPTRTTNADGSYSFDNLPAGAYVVAVTGPAGYTQTGDPDATLDHRTTAPVVLAPGDVYVNADFGYQPTGNAGDIGDTIWLDVDRNDAIDAGEPGLAGVTVALIQDLDGDGVWDAGEPIIATDVTDVNGAYLFTNLPATGVEDYLVWVNDTENVLSGLTPTYDSNGAGSPNLSAVSNLTTADNLLQDFAYAPTGHDAAERLIGDTVFYDGDADGVYDAGEGMEGILIELYQDTNADGNYDAGEPLLASTYTNENGQYFFGGLSAGNYVVKVDTTTLPAGVTNTVDVGGAPTDEGGVDLTVATSNLNQDFGYRDTSNPNSVSGTIWRDTDADGLLEVAETGRFNGVTVVLRDANGNIIAATTTDVNGDYSFTNLPNGSYTVDVSDDANLLNGYWKSSGAASTDNNSQSDPLSVTLSGSTSITYADFGYYRDPAVIGNFVWNDADGDGIQDGGEAGISGVTVTLTVTWPAGGGTTTVATTTDGSGNYSFGNLLLDEDFDGSGAGEPTFSIAVSSPGAGYSITISNAGGDDNLDSDGATITALPVEGTTNNSYDAGFLQAGAVGNFTWVDLDGDGQQDGGEPGLPGVTVQLYTSGNVLVSTTISDASGAYSFASVPAGNYYLVFTTPTGYNLTLQDQGADASDSDPNPATGQTATFTVTAGVTDNTRDAGFAPAQGSVGDYVWLDEDGDGVQDAGESGIPNVVVTISGTDIFGNAVNRTTRTDADGKFLFPGIQAGTYTVTTSGLPAGLSANPTYDLDGVGTASTTSVTVQPGQQRVDVDFGYNWVPPTDTSNPPPAVTTGAIGDRVWIDVDGDGVQDAGEAGLGSVTVQLRTPGADGIFGTLDDAGFDGIIGTADDNYGLDGALGGGDDPASSIYATTTTDAAGNYVFDGLPAGVYRVFIPATPTGYTQTGDPDSTLDNTSTTPIVLAPGDVYVNADFGYQPNAGVGYAIGDTFWVDADGDNTVDAGEPRLPGVTVSLIRDTDGDGIWDAGELVIATAITDANGQYLFGGLPITDGAGSDDYLVWVNDTANVLGGLVAAYDADGASPATGLVTGLGISAVTDLGATDNLTQDFAYIPSGHTAGEGLIGDTIYLDRDAGSDFDPGEGLEGVRVNLFSDTNGDGNYDPDEPLVASTLTNKNGGYYFGNLPASPTNYVVMVDTTTLPAGVTNTVDPDTTNSPANESGLTPLASGEINLAQDFGYAATTPRTISGTLWRDSNADGILSGESGRFAGVTVVLRDSAGKVVATTTTDINGDYSFPAVPDGATYRVDVTDDAKVLKGYWHSSGDQSQATDGTSKNDPYTVTLAGSNVSTVDFGYYRDVAVLGNHVWLDLDSDGVKDAGEPGIEGVVVTLTITYPNTDVATIYTTTGTDGVYSFGNLMLDENYDGAGGSEPTYAVSVSAPPGTSASPENAGGNSDQIDDDSDGASENATIVKGETDTTYDFGFISIRLDLGDLPTTIEVPGLGQSYPTNFGQGAAHVIAPDGGDNIPNAGGGYTPVWLGTIADVEVNGSPSAAAVGDDGLSVDDEDGLTLASSGWVAGGSSTATIRVNSDGPARVYYGFWIDWNRDGDWADAGDAFYSGSGRTASPLDIPVTVNVPGGYVVNSDVYMRVRSDDQPITSADYDGTRLNGEVEDYLFQFNSGGTPTPVTLSYFTAWREGENTIFNWSTSTETGNVGFHIYAEKDGNRFLLNPQLIPSLVLDSLYRQDYTFTVRTDATIFYVEDVGIENDTRLHGPFSIGEAYGSRVDGENVDWAAIAAETEGEAQVRVERLLPEMRSSDVSGLNLSLAVRKDGIYRVTYEMLRDAGFNLTGMQASRLTLRNRGQVVPLRVGGKTQFGPGSYIEFYGLALDTIYTDTNIYHLSVSDKASARIVAEGGALRKKEKISTTYTEKLVVNRQRAFANYTPSNDAWYDTYMLTYTSAKSWNFDFNISNLAAKPGKSTLDLVIWGVNNWANIEEDHHVVVSVNGSEVSDVRFGGLVEKTLQLSLPAGLLREGSNTLTITLPGDSGGRWDIVNLDKFTVTYTRDLVAQDGRLTFTATGANFQVKNLPSSNVSVYRLDGKRAVRLTNPRIKAESGSYTVSFAGSKRLSTYVVVSEDAKQSPAISVTRIPNTDALNRPAEYLVISHPDFVAGLQPLLDARRAQGLSVNVVDVNDLYVAYNQGIFDPQAIKSYLAYAAKNLGVKYVLLVGGDTYDYRNHLGINSISFIPSIYVQTGATSRMVPVDPKFVDFNNDNVPDLAIGRFPVRTVAELDLLVQKTLAYGRKDYARTAFFAADSLDPAVSFTAISESLVSRLPANWTVGKAYLDSMSLSNARASLLSAMNRGTALVTFTGHSGPVSWTYKNLFSNADAAALTNAGRPFVTVQWGCWNTYYVDPLKNYMVQSLLFSGDRGAAAVFGASTLTNSKSEQMLGELLNPRLVKSGTPIGLALYEAKRELAKTNPEMLDVLLGWTLMGDPALVVEP